MTVDIRIRFPIRNQVSNGPPRLVNPAVGNPAPCVEMNISTASILSGYIPLMPNTVYLLTSNLLIDGISFIGFTGGDGATTLIGQGYTITNTDLSYVGTISFPEPIVLSYLTLINPVNSESWGNATTDVTCNAFVGPFGDPIPVGTADISGDFYIHLISSSHYQLTTDLLVNASFAGFWTTSIVDSFHLSHSGIVLQILQTPPIQNQEWRYEYILNNIRTTSELRTSETLWRNMYDTDIRVRDSSSIPVYRPVERLHTVRPCYIHRTPTCRGVGLVLP
jgi:hypothetical protein